MARTTNPRLKNLKSIKSMDYFMNVVGAIDVWIVNEHQLNQVLILAMIIWKQTGNYKSNASASEQCKYQLTETFNSCGSVILINALYAILHMVIPAKYTTKDMRGNWTMVFIEFTTKLKPLMSSCCKEQGEVSILHPTCNHIFQKSRIRKIYEEYHRQMVWYDIC